jgi:hypothetical protein
MDSSVLVSSHEHGNKSSGSRNFGGFFASKVTVSFFQMTLLHGINYGNMLFKVPKE